MYSLSRSLRLAALAIAAFAFVSCASIGVSSFLDRGAEFARYRTYSWDPAAALDTGDPRLDNNPFFHERIRVDVEKQLARRGFEKITSGRPDVVVQYRASVLQRIHANIIDPAKGYCDGNNCKPYVYETGTLWIDFVDVRTGKLVWRGWAEDSVDGSISNQQLMERQIDNAVTRILQRVPPRL
jgi:hypothetical protein